jgi:hypothetical protein
MTVRTDRQRFDAVVRHDDQGARTGGQFERRGSERFEDTQHVAIINQRQRLICELVDLSEAGAKVRIVDGPVPAEGELIALALFDGTEVPARVTWIGAKALGLTFSKPLSTVETHLISETLGRDYFGKAVRLQRLATRVRD